MGTLLVFEARPRYGGVEGEEGLNRTEVQAPAPAPAPAPADLSRLPDLARFRAINSGCDPFRIPGVIALIEDAVVTLSGHLHSGIYVVLCYVGELDRLQGWKLGGHRDCAAWLCFRAGPERGTAQEWVRTARALRRMPLTSAAMARGELSFSKVRCLTRAVDDLEEATARQERADPGDPGKPDAADPDDPEANPDPPEAALVEFARKCTTAQLERVVREWRILQVHDEAALERRRHASRSLAISPDGDGMYRIRGTLSPEVGALLMRAVEAAGDALFREGAEWGPEGARRGPASREVTPRQRRADALGLIAERALAAGFGVGEEEDRGDVPADSAAEVPTDASVEGGTGSSAIRDSTPCTCSVPASTPLSGTRAERYQVLIHVDADALRSSEGEVSDQHRSDPRGFARLADGTPLSAEGARRLSCDGALVRVTRGPEGEVLDIGRRSRSIPPALRRALEVRDGGCRFPGCSLRFTEGHHILHWADGGETKLSNLVLLCRHHHRAVHEEGFRIRLDPCGRVRFLDRVGWPLPEVPPPPPVLPDRPVEALVRFNHRRGITPDWDTPSATYPGEADIPYHLEARFREALDLPA